MEASWQPARFTAPTEFSNVPLAPPVIAPALDGKIDREQITVEIDGEEVQGLVYGPLAGGQHPAVMFVHGAGTKDRTEFEEQATFLARSGLVALVLNKRTTGYSAWR